MHVCKILQAPVPQRDKYHHHAWCARQDKMHGLLVRCEYDGRPRLTRGTRMLSPPDFCTGAQRPSPRPM